MKTEIIIMLKENNRWVVLIRGNNLEEIINKYENKLTKKENNTAKLEMTTYVLHSFISSVKRLNLEIEYTELF